MIKLSNEHIKTVLTKVASTLRSQNTKIAELEEMVEHHKKKDRAEDLAKKMEEKNINSEHSHEEKVAKLMAADDLDVIERAIDMSSDKFDKIANVDSQAGNSTDSFSQLYSYVLSEV